MFRYGVVRVWQLPAEAFLGGGLGILPLAPLGAVAEAELPGLIRRMEQRISAEATRDEAGTLWTAADVLMGLRYPPGLVTQLLRGGYGMKDSVTYQAIVEEGEVKDRHAVLLQLGRKRFGPPDFAVETALRNIIDLDRLAHDRRRARRFQLGRVAGDDVADRGHGRLEEFLPFAHVSRK